MAFPNFWPLSSHRSVLVCGDRSNWLLYRIRIHGTSQPGSIGRAVSSGCVRLLNVNVIDLYNLVSEGTKVVVLQSKRKSPTIASAQPPQAVQVSRRTRLLLIRERLRRQSVESRLIRKTNFNLKKP
jgi:hypothetical protein